MCAMHTEKKFHAIVYYSRHNYKECFVKILNNKCSSKSGCDQYNDPMLWWSFSAIDDIFQR